VSPTFYIVAILILVIVILGLALHSRPTKKRVETFTPPTVKPVADAGKKAVEVTFHGRTDEVEKASTSDTPASDIADLANRRRT
jgi:hypothetical protein